MRKLATLWGAALALTLASAGAQAQSGAWPQRPIRIITPTPAGVGSDVFARAYAERLGQMLKTPVVVENRPGALAAIGTDAVAKAAPDGYTILFSTSNPFTMTPFLLSKLPYNPQTDLVPVTQALKGGSFIVANPSVPAKNLVELVALAKKDPGRVSFASYGSGSTAHLGFELLQDAAGIELLHVPYKQSAMPDVIAGQVMLGFEPPISALPNIRAGRVKPIAYTGSQRSAALPDVPTLAERYPGLEVFTWLGFWLPAKTPPEIVDRFNREIRAATQSPELQRLIAEAGLEPMGTTPEETRAIVRREAEAMGKLIKAKNIRID
ncbi:MULTISPECIES: Bug family tripartite tricarboxylate transporter substrate binding protein [unclassified Variovorax]|jgi:tripartite-type tricarboxylate transporter receptor subunit TctC|uniref:Bug family tripartite tricarboxylate transporter substrate binding protein n=1 Tax=unclassified Variovorax TaxID=663243 RepID=UPI0008E8BFDF|nr:MULTISPECIES: tripartite tricarboxylate transporter substrate binding protein [unclassified Variovorax]TAJ58069.1 MAG: tripartite tricarboxylate transporter substrate binding protein [Variovorax sp.]SFP46292.1 Tripartite-type tricarboxylate transporter, receptor component TctC [Variovorax sp. PDC80]